MFSFVFIHPCQHPFNYHQRKWKTFKKITLEVHRILLKERQRYCHCDIKCDKLIISSFIWKRDWELEKLIYSSHDHVGEWDYISSLTLRCVTSMLPYFGLISNKHAEKSVCVQVNAIWHLWLPILQHIVYVAKYPFKNTCLVAREQVLTLRIMLMEQWKRNQIVGFLMEGAVSRYC